MSYNPPQKRARPNSFQYESNNSHNQTPSVPYPNVCLQASTQIVEYLEKLSQYKQNENSHVEIELRLGLYVENTFHSGVTKEFFDEYEHNLASSGKYTCTESDETDYNVENPYYNRITVNNNGTIEALDKTRLQLPLDLPHRFRFDCRISSAKETPFLGSTPITKPTTWTSMRKKSRKQFDKQNSFWFIHLTQVVSCDSAGNPKKTSYEVEYELKDPANLLDKQRRDYAVGELWNMIVSLLGDTVAQLEMHLGEVKEEHVPFLQEACWRMVRPDTLGQGFPGSMPVSFSRRHMTTVQNNSYFLSEKTDGIRYMLMITPRGVFMIGRKFDFYPLVTYRELGVWAKSHGNTLIDGELVRTLPRNEKERPTLTYMIFDVIQFDGQFIGDLPFAQRMQRIGTIVQWHRTEGQKTAPFQMIGKIFYPKEKFETLKEHIKVEGRDRIYDDGKKRRHKTDGFILTPNDAYSPKGTANLFKWKYSDLLSIDFQIVPDNHGTLMLACGGEGDRLIVCRQLELLEEDENKVKQIIESNRLLRRFERDAHNAWLRRPAGAIILEMTYDPAFGVWRYHLERTDKSKPNHITVVFDTMEAIAENITEAEIYYRLVRSPEYDNWDQRNK